MRSERVPRGLYAVTPETGDDAWLATRVAEALAGGAAMLQYRAKALGPGQALAQARCLAQLCRDHAVPFIVNDSIPLALAVGADGIHVGRDDAGVREARIAMPRGIVGASCYADPELARRAAAEGADYVAVGSMFPSSTKPLARPAALEVIAAAKAASGLPVAAIGGITQANAARVVAGGAQLLAVIAALFEAPDVRLAAREFNAMFTNANHGDVDVRAQPRTV
jgi:thiamine-phosphate pyrophosphorylase